MPAKAPKKAAAKKSASFSAPAPPAPSLTPVSSAPPGFSQASGMSDVPAGQQAEFNPSASQAASQVQPSVDLLAAVRKQVPPQKPKAKGKKAKTPASTPSESATDDDEDEEDEDEDEDEGEDDATEEDSDDISVPAVPDSQKRTASQTSAPPAKRAALAPAAPAPAAAAAAAAAAATPAAAPAAPAAPPAGAFGAATPVPAAAPVAPSGFGATAPVAAAPVGGFGGFFGAKPAAAAPAPAAPAAAAAAPAAPTPTMAAPKPASAQAAAPAAPAPPGAWGGLGSPSVSGLGPSVSALGPSVSGLGGPSASGLSTGSPTRSPKGSRAGSPKRPEVKQLPRNGWQYRRLKEQTKDVASKIQQFEEAFNTLPGLRDAVSKMSDTIFSAQKEKMEKDMCANKEQNTYELKQVQLALADQNQTALDAQEVSTLRNLGYARDNEAAQQQNRVRQEVNQQVADQVRFTELEFQKNYAELSARLSATDAERKALHDEIASLRNDVTAQKKLSRDIATAKGSGL